MPVRMMHASCLATGERTTEKKSESNLNHIYIVEPADQWDTLYKNLDKQPSSPGVPVAQWLEHPNGVTEVVGSVPARDSDFFALVLSPVAKQLAYIILTGIFHH